MTTGAVTVADGVDDAAAGAPALGDAPVDVDAPVVALVVGLVDDGAVPEVPADDAAVVWDVAFAWKLPPRPITQPTASIPMPTVIVLTRRTARSLRVGVNSR